MKLNKKFKVLAIGAALVLSIGAVGCSKQEEAPKEEAKQEQAKAEVKTIEKNMPELICPNCGAEFEYKKTDDR